MEHNINCQFGLRHGTVCIHYIYHLHQKLDWQVRARGGTAGQVGQLIYSYSRDIDYKNYPQRLLSADTDRRDGLTAAFINYKRMGNETNKCIESKNLVGVKYEQL